MDIEPVLETKSPIRIQVTYVLCITVADWHPSRIVQDHLSISRFLPNGSIISISTVTHHIVAKFLRAMDRSEFFHLSAPVNREIPAEVLILDRIDIQHQLYTLGSEIQYIGLSQWESRSF